jgi:hypothetical protein
MTDLFDLTQQLDMAAAEPYLRAHGWELAYQGDLGNRWRLRQDEDVRNVAVPLLRIDEVDRRRMLVAVLQTLAEIEDRSPLLIARDLREAGSDLIEFRLTAEPLRVGEMPLRAASELTGGAYGALQAAARAELARRPHYAQGTLPTPVRCFLDGATLAGTDRGSVILRVRPPLPPEPPQPSIDGLSGSAPFERRVAHRLIEGVRAAKAATHRDLATTELDILDDDIEDGLSANLCDALLDLAGTKAGLDARLAIRVRWALTRPVDEAATSVEVERGELGRLPEVAQILKQIDPRPNTTVLGPVTRFHREPGDQVGSVWMLADVEDKARTVRLQLERSDYELAMRAHSRDLEVRAVGTLERAGWTRELTDPSSFEVLGDAAESHR